MSSLEAGTYTIAGSMVKADKATASMADKGINHRIKMTVSANGSKTLTLRFMSVAVNGKSSYLGRVKYYKNGYSASASGPSGSLANAKIISYVKGKGGKNLVDEYGTDYPQQVSIPLISQAQKDGYVPLQFFVPIMEKIAAGNGTQSAYLKLDLSSITAGDSSTSDTGQSSSGANSSSSSAGTSAKSSKSGGSVLSKNTLGDDDDDAPASAATTGGTLEEVDDSALASGGLTAESALGGTGPNAALNTVTTTNTQQDVKAPPLRDRVPALLGVPAGIAALAVGYSSLKRRRGGRY